MSEKRKCEMKQVLGRLLMFVGSIPTLPLLYITTEAFVTGDPGKLLNTGFVFSVIMSPLTIIYGFYIYKQGENVCVHVSKPYKHPICGIDIYNEEGRLMKGHSLVNLERWAEVNCTLCRSRAEEWVKTRGAL